MNKETHQLKSLVINHWAWIIFAIILLFVIPVRIRLLSVPLERDEGEYAYAGQLILQGILPYQEVYNMKLPGVYFAYAAIMAIFGQTIQGIHTGLLVINLVSICMIFSIAKKIMRLPGALVTTASFAVLSISQPLQGIFANAEHFVILFVLGGVLLMLQAIKKQHLWRFFVSGTLFGTSFIMKQHAIAFIMFAVLYVFFTLLKQRPLQWKKFTLRLILFTLGTVSPFMLICLIFIAVGSFEKFWFWTVNYALSYVSPIPLKFALENFLWAVKDILAQTFTLWILAGFGLIAVLYKGSKQYTVFVLMYTFFSVLAICPGFYFRPHYFIFLLPIISLLTGIAIDTLENILKHFRRLKYAILFSLAVIILSIPIYQQRNFLFKMTPFQACRCTYGHAQPFPESLVIARFIKENTKPTDRIAVIGSEPQIYFYSRRRSATSYMYMYPLMEKHDFALQMQKEMIIDIESANPKMIVLANSEVPRDFKNNPETLIIEWSRKYLKEHYYVIGIANTISDDEVIYCWGKDVVNYSPKSKIWILLFKRYDTDEIYFHQ